MLCNNFLIMALNFTSNTHTNKKQPECPSGKTGENELWFIQRVGYYGVMQPRNNKDTLCTDTTSKYTLLNGTRQRPRKTTPSVANAT